MGSGVSHIPVKSLDTSRESESNMSSLYFTGRSQQPQDNNRMKTEVKRRKSSISNIIISEELCVSNDSFDTDNMLRTLPDTDIPLNDEDRRALKSITVPIPINEAKRLKILRQSNLFDSTIFDPEFDRFTSLAHHIFEVSCLTHTFFKFLSENNYS